MMDRPDLAAIPEAPGSYQFRDGEDRVIYVGKARNLRARVGSYFQDPRQLSPKTRAMLAVASRLTWIVVPSEQDALLLEYSLIKEHHPRYNIRLRDDKSYPMIAVTVGERWPRAMIYRGKRRRGARYFGPYADAGAAREVLELLRRALPLRTCSPAKLAQHERAGRPCLYFDIGRCVGPCIGAVDEATYRGLVDEVTGFLEGRAGSLVDALETEMHAAASRLEFEEAARLRDRLSAIEAVLERQSVALGHERDLDAIGVHRDELDLYLEVVRVRHGRIVGVGGARAERDSGAMLFDELLDLVRSYYDDQAIDVPPRIVARVEVAEAREATDALTSLLGRPVRVVTPYRRELAVLVEIAERNAALAHQRARRERATDLATRSRGLTELGELAGLGAPPVRIECFDMSHLQGRSYVGSMVVMEDGLMRHGAYRHFRVSVPHNDDVGAMREVLSRRLDRLDDRRFGGRPDLIVLDGGAPQLNGVLRLLEERGMAGTVPVVALAKSFEELYVPDRSEPVRVPRGTLALYLLQQLRDEAHRFAITYHRRRRQLDAERSTLESIPGLGPARRARLLAEFGSIYEIAEASEAELVRAGVPARVASAVRERLGPLYRREPESDPDEEVR
ncbi:excinuclease ABC, C subunit [Acidimicrobium ferrooxidans DSM 10331]|uniref:UvrABC system protein C n=1 Tax=Acidimicrobium ferrooxidans (strain DSM 10331 / JCM 15462 / NBRC 103882 / ICP) TaxID=525909 RepID=C7LYI3_ACIFD|nr:excinuclease ABC subunit UvrC [Acidimicrobium ferrooxidans]ACU53791.1 excinuclease ABC, C subunit [Acidimicrobium ferrooxidans DSM 10331]